MSNKYPNFKELPNTQRKVLDFCEVFYQKYKRFPRVKEISEKLEMTKMHVYYSLARLIKRGIIRKKSWGRYDF